jgi:hypothetical protein
VSDLDVRLAHAYEEAINHRWPIIGTRDGTHRGELMEIGLNSREWFTVDEARAAYDRTEKPDAPVSRGALLQPEAHNGASLPTKP